METPPNARRREKPPEQPVQGFGVAGLAEAALFSTNLAAAGYDSAHRRLYIKFRGGSMYGYENVPPRAFEMLRMNDSPGRYFRRHIRNKYAAQRHAPGHPE